MPAARQLRCTPRLVIPPCRHASHRPGRLIPKPNAQSLGLRKLWGEKAVQGLTRFAGSGTNGGGGNGQRRPRLARMARMAACLGQFLLTVLNPTSAVAHLAELRSLPGDVVILAEPSLTAGGQKFASSQLREGIRGFSAVWGPPQPMRAIKGTPRSEWDAVPGGTGTLARKPLGIQKVEAPLPARDLVLPGEIDLVAEGRLLHTAVPIGSGHTVLHCLT